MQYLKIKYLQDKIINKSELIQYYSIDIVIKFCSNATVTWKTVNNQDQQNVP